VVENYRAFRHAEMTLPEEGLVLVAGANNSGESALLSAFDVVAGSIDEAGSRRHVGASSSPQVTALFTLSDEERRVILGLAVSGDQLFDHCAVTRLEFLFEGENEASLELVRVRAEWPGHGLQPLVLAGPFQGGVGWERAARTDARAGGCRYWVPATLTTARLQGPPGGHVISV